MPATPSGVEFFQTLSEASQRYFFRQLVAALPQFRDGDSQVAQSRDKKAFTEVLLLGPGTPLELATAISIVSDRHWVRFFVRRSELLSQANDPMSAMEMQKWAARAQQAIEEAIGTFRNLRKERLAPPRLPVRTREPTSRKRRMAKVRLDVNVDTTGPATPVVLDPRLVFAD